MRKRQVFALFFCGLAIWTMGNGLLPLLPVYATQLGAAPTAVGTYLSLSYFCLATGTVVAGWLSDRLERRKALLVVGGVVGIPAMWMMGRATNVWSLTVLTAVAWFLAGAILALVSTLTGLFADQAERGRVFGILSLTNALGALIGGLVTGPIVDRWGYATLFAVLAVVWSISPLAALFVEDRAVARARGGEASAAREKSRLGGRFTLLLLASIVASTAVFVGRLGTSLAMQELDFVAAAISSTQAMSGAITLPLPPLLGWLSDRVDRKRLMALCYLTGTVGLLVLTVSISLWHFWVAAAVLTVVSYVNSGVGSALVTDLVPEESLGRGMSLFSATLWVGGFIGFAGTGYAVQNLGTGFTFIVGALLPLIAIVLLIPVRRDRA